VSVMSGLIRVGVIGAGHWGPNLIRNFHNGRTSEVLIVADVNQPRLAEVESRYPGVRITTDAQEVVNSDVDAVVVATPTSTHFELSKAVLENGKHVLVEKPMATSAPEAEELCDLAARQEKVLLVGHVFIYNAGVRRVKEILQIGEMGLVYYIAMVRTNLGPIRMDVNAAWDLAAHDVSIANYWLDSEPLSVAATGGNWINDGLHDVVFANLRYPKDVLVNLHVSWLNPRKSRDITVVGEKKMLTLDDMDLSEPIRTYDKGVSEERTIPGFVDTYASFRASVREGDVSIPRVAMGEPLQAECDHFLECISNGTPPETDGLSGLAVVRTLEAIERSMKSGGGEEPV
jgi:predicted dehydrogenase